MVTMKVGGKAKGKAPKKAPKAGAKATKKTPKTTVKKAPAGAKATKKPLKTTLKRAPAVQKKTPKVKTPTPTKAPKIPKEKPLKTPKKKTLKTPKDKTPKTPKDKAPKMPKERKKPAGKPKALTNHGIELNSQLLKTSKKVQGGEAIPGTSKTPAKKRAPKRKLDQPKAGTPKVKKIKQENLGQVTMNYEDKRNIRFNVNQAPSYERRYEDNHPIQITLVNPVQTSPGPYHSRAFNPSQERFNDNNYRVQNTTAGQVQPNPAPTHQDPPSQGQHSYNQIPGPSSLSEHFVDKHREALIQRLSHVEPVLDYLLGQRLLTQEQYDVIRTKEPYQEKMRQLYQFITTWGNTDKEKLYQAIRRTNEPLIRDLEGC